MSEEQNQGQSVPDAPDAQSSAHQEQKREHMIPKGRFDEEAKRRKEAERKLTEIEQVQQQREEERAQAQGEYQQLAEKRQKKIDSLQKEISDLKNQITRDSRYRVWTAAAAGVVRPNAISDAFDMVSEDEWSTVNLDDDASVRRVAQDLIDRKDYLAASPTGAGSRGSSNPVMGLKSNGGKVNLPEGSGVEVGSLGSRPTLHFKKSRKHWK